MRPKPKQGRDGGFCEQYPVAGQTRCKVHGGSAPQAIAAAQRRGLEASAAALAVTYGLPVEVDPVDALLGELWRTQGVVLWLQAQIQGLTPNEVHWGTTEVKEIDASQFGGTDRTESAAAHVLIQLYQSERAHLAKVSRDCVSVGIELKLVQRMDAIAADVMAKIAAVVRAFGFDPESPESLRIVAAVMRGEQPPLVIEGDVA